MANATARIQGLDLIRGFAILLVLLRHSWPAPFGGGGIVGVVVFFALSGYLITGLLTSDLQRFGRVRYGRFYLHRAVRLLPALCAVLLVYGLINVTIDPLREGLKNTAWGIFTGITYTGNIPGQPRGAALGHLWTLATEEQFYVVWPILLAIGLRFRSAWLAAALAFGTVSVGLTMQFICRSDRLETIYSMPFSWAMAMVIGSAAQLWTPTVRRVLPAAGRARAALSGLAVAVLLGLCFLPEVKDQPLAYLVGGPLIALCTVVLIFHLSTWRSVQAPALRPLLWLGTVSYAAYLWNYPMTKWFAGHDQVLGGHATWLAVLATLVAAAVSWFLIEQPTQRLRRRIDTRLQTPAKVVGVLPQQRTAPAIESAQRSVSRAPIAD